MCISGDNNNALVSTKYSVDEHAQVNELSEDHNYLFSTEPFPNLGSVESSNTSNKHDEFDLNDNPSRVLSEIRRKSFNRPVIGHININFLEGKFDALKLFIEDKLDVLVVTETKIDDSYPTSQFGIKGFGTPFRHDRNKYGGGVLVYIREHLPCREIPIVNKPRDFEGIFIELTLRKKRCAFIWRV